ncbi:MAG: methyltransferase protein [Actinomycetia bacterium]|nr:methyltransferase protein [Actinomycetes bacterium]
MARALVSSKQLLLPPREAVAKTNELDQGDWNYRPGLGWVSRLRLRAVAAALAGPRAGRLLEVGYGSGVFLPELAKHCNELFGIDVHQNASMVDAMLKTQGVRARLLSGSATDLPFSSGAFDAVVTVSTLEFVPDVPKSVAELLRVTSPGGRVVAVTPLKSPILDFGLRIMTGERGEDTFEGRRGTIVPAFERLGRVERIVRLPPVVSRLLPLYAVVVARPR